MPKFDLDSLALPELEELAGSVAVAIEKRRESDTAALAEKLRKEAEAAGLDPDAVAKALGRGGKKRAPARPKYRSPEDAAKTWTGKGKKPRWVQEQLEGGKSLDELLIP